MHVVRSSYYQRCARGSVVIVCTSKKHRTTTLSMLQPDGMAIVTERLHMYGSAILI